MFPGRGHVHHGGVLWEGQRDHCVYGSRTQLSFYIVYSSGGSSGFEGRLSFWAGRTIDEIDDLHHADRTTPSDLHDQGRGMFRVICGALSCRFHEFPAGAHNVLFQGPRCGPTRPLAFNGTASRPPLWVDSPAGVL